MPAAHSIQNEFYAIFIDKQCGKSLNTNPFTTTLLHGIAHVFVSCGCVKAVSVWCNTPRYTPLESTEEKENVVLYGLARNG